MASKKLQARPERVQTLDVATKLFRLFAMHAGLAYRHDRVQQGRRSVRCAASTGANQQLLMPDGDVMTEHVGDLVPDEPRLVRESPSLDNIACFHQHRRWRPEE